MGSGQAAERRGAVASPAATAPSETLSAPGPRPSRREVAVSDRASGTLEDEVDDAADAVEDAVTKD